MSKKVLFVRIEGTCKSGVEKDLNEILTTIKNDYDSNIDDWWDNAYLTDEMDLISDNCRYGNFYFPPSFVLGENAHCLIEDEGKCFYINEYLSSRIK